jgi:hypothetical protein
MWRGRDLHGGGESAPRKELLRNKTCDQLYVYGRDVFQEVSVGGEGVSSTHPFTPVYK